MIAIRTSRTAMKAAYQFANDVTAELETRLRDRGIDETTLADHDVERIMTPEGNWIFKLDGETVLTAMPAERIIE